jgi:hypothetical protein
VKEIYKNQALPSSGGLFYFMVLIFEPLEEE